MKVDVHNDIVHLRVRLALIPQPPSELVHSLALVSLVSWGPLHLTQAQFSYWSASAYVSLLLSVKWRMGEESVDERINEQTLLAGGSARSQIVVLV